MISAPLRSAGGRSLVRGTGSRIQAHLWERWHGDVASPVMFTNVVQGLTTYHLPLRYEEPRFRRGPIKGSN